jgi:hypothetical protein
MSWKKLLKPMRQKRLYITLPYAFLCEKADQGTFKNQYLLHKKAKLDQKSSLP